jgi:carbon-monoxide dehydrogenase medium subunit
MIPASFDYYRAGSVDEALGLLKEHPGAKLLAGGHSLLPMLKLRLAQPAALVDIGRIAELKGISVDGGSLHVGPLTRHHDLATSEAVRQHCPVLAEAAAKVGDPQVRNRGTVGGNIAHADPASDLPAALLAAGATVHLTGSGGKRSVAAEDFFVDLLMTDLRPDEMLTGIEIPCLEGKVGSAYLKVEHPASGYAVCGAAAVVWLDRGGSCAKAALAFNGVAPKPVRAPEATAALVGSSLGDEAIENAVRQHLQVEDPLGDIHASGPYRVELAKVYGARALKLARDRARG